VGDSTAELLFTIGARKPKGGRYNLDNCVRGSVKGWLGGEGIAIASKNCAGGFSAGPPPPGGDRANVGGGKKASVEEGALHIRPKGTGDAVLFWSIVLGNPRKRRPIG